MFFCNGTAAVFLVICEYNDGLVAMFPCVQVFPSTVRYGKWFWGILWSSVALFVVLFLAGLGVKEKKSTAALIGGAFCLLCVVIFVPTSWGFLS